MAIYSLKKTIKGQFHLFAGKLDGEECVSKQTSLCGKMDNSESIESIFACEDDISTRKKCAEIGKPICGICISYLYTTN
jgi:hypothetical protein